MKISYITDARLPTERAHGIQIVKMCEAFATSGAEVLLVSPRKQSGEIKVDLFSYYGVKRNFTSIKLSASDFLGKTLRFGRIFSILDICSFLFSLLRFSKTKSDIFYARDPLLLLPFSRKNGKLVLELHQIPSRRFLFKKLVGRVDKIIVLTRFLKEDLVAFGIEAERILVAEDAVDIREFEVLETKIEAREKLSLPLDKKIVLYTGHLYGWKGADTLAGAALLSRDNITFVFVGGVDRELEAFREKYKEARNIQLVPFVAHDKIPLYMRASDVCVLPNSGKTELSARYTSPLKLFEYMAAGKPIVASDLPSIREILKESNAVLATPDDSENFLLSIQRVLEDEGFAKRLSEAALRDVQAHTWEKRAERILHHIKS